MAGYLLENSSEKNFLTNCRSNYSQASANPFFKELSQRFKEIYNFTKFLELNDMLEISLKIDISKILFMQKLTEMQV